MHAEWIKSPTARRILVHWTDPRPAWLWSGDGQRLLWRNRAARYFGAGADAGGLKLAPAPVPIKGQVARLIRLGAVGRPSLSRIQFLSGERPVSQTCTITPLLMADGAAGLLIVGVDPVDEAILAAGQGDDPATEALFPADSEYLLVKAGQVAGGSAGVLEQLPPEVVAGGLPQLPTGSETVEFDGWRGTVSRYKAGPGDAMLLLFVPVETAETATSEGPADAAEPDAGPAAAIETVAIEASGDTAAEPPAVAVPSHPVATGVRTAAAAVAPPETREEPAPLEPEPEAEPEPAAANPESEHTLRAIIDFADEDAQPTAPRPATPATSGEPDREAVERVSRYNFDELSRILNDRIGGGDERAGRAARPSADTTEPEPEPTEPSGLEPAAASAAPPAQREGQLINLAGETIILNRLPLGILVFRDQQVLFANRSITEMIGYGSVDELRTAGLGAIFPDTGDSEQQAGPVNHLVQRDGTLVPVTARLQSISWQGRPALMLSASATEVRTSHETAVRAFAEHLAVARGDGFIETMRSGVISQITPTAIAMLGLEKPIVGKPITAVIAPDAVPGLRSFLERPARFAETTRPHLVVPGIKPGTELLIFAQGQAGIVSNYFALVRMRPGAVASAAAAVAAPEGDAGPRGEIEAPLMGRVSRGLRRPLNTIVGFADLIASSAFGPIHNPRYVEYARDIRTAGMEIAAVVDELDDYVRLREGDYQPRLSEVDLVTLLNASVVRVRTQAAGARVLIRSAISERLPRVRVDRSALGQAVLNLLASAIDQTPPGGAVIFSAKVTEDGGVAIHVRDSGKTSIDLAERFVVFRDDVDRNGAVLAPVRSTVGLALTRSLLEVNQVALSIDPAGGSGTLFSLVIPPSLVSGERRPLVEPPPVKKS